MMMTPALHRPNSKGLGAIPWVQLGMFAASTIIGLIANRKGGKQKRQATFYVDQVEPMLQRNVEEFLAGPQTTERQDAALYAFDAAWDQLRAECSDPALGDPGRRCISERQRGGRWDWFALYRDPIANAPVTSGVLTPDGLVTAATADPVPFLIGGLVLLAVLS